MREPPTYAIADGAAQAALEAARAEGARLRGRGQPRWHHHVQGGAAQAAASGSRAGPGTGLRPRSTRSMTPDTAAPHGREAPCVPSGGTGTGHHIWSR